ncbi:MAG TPA: VOC family protein [Polyangiaceae bacterium]|nr:VOC family protein [Polyangiaceae bacterium]
MANPFVHIELSSSDLKKAEKFYRSIFGWKLQNRPEFDYTMIDVGNGGVGGGMQTQRQPGAPSAWLPYVEVDDVKATVAKAAKNGAKVMLPYMDIGESMGAIGVFSDPTGAVIGVWQKGAAVAAAKPEKPAKAKAAKPKKPVKVAAKTVKAAAKLVQDAAKKIAKKAKKVTGRGKK